MHVTLDRRFARFVAGTILATCFVVSRAPLAAQTLTSNGSATERPAPPPTAYSSHGGRWDFGAQVGYTMEYGLDWHEVSHIQMLIAEPQLGFIVHDFAHSPVRRFELIDEGILGAAVHPRSAYLAGDALILRFSGKEHGRWVPFFDAGAGVQRTPLSKYVPEVNGYTQFTPQGGVGVEYFLRPQRAVVFEWRTIHMSNADLVPPNMGFNSSMLTVGLRWWRKPN